MSAAQGVQWESLHAVVHGTAADLHLYSNPPPSVCRGTLVSLLCYQGDQMSGHLKHGMLLVISTWHDLSLHPKWRRFGTTDTAGLLKRDKLISEGCVTIYCARPSVLAAPPAEELLQTSSSLLWEEMQLG